MSNDTEKIFIPRAEPSQSSAFMQNVVDAEISGNSLANLDNVEDFSHMCRTCATVTEFVIPIFAGEGLHNKLAEKIHKHLPIQVCESDVLPRALCYQCASTLLAWHELVQCCVQADVALRARLPKEPMLNIKSNSTVEDEIKTKLFYMNVKNALIDFLHNDLEEDDLDVEFVCQKCIEKPALTTVHGLAEHMKYDHSSDTTDSKSIKTFITNYITFEQVLIEDSDRDTDSDDKEKSQIVLPSLYCPFCVSVFSSPTRLIYHLNKHVEVSIGDGVRCCDVIYNNKKHFVQHLQEAHVRTSEDAVKSVCVSCGFTADDVDALKKHYKDAHNDIKSDKQKKVESPNNQKYIPAVCPECNKTFSNKYNMFVHMRSHTDTTLYACDKCTKTYRNQGNLNTHKRLAHEGILKFLCLECGEAFPSRLERDIHSRLHTGEKPFKCEHCGNSYRAKNTLTRHLDIHLNIRKYECEICSKKFRKKSHLDYHIKTHMKYTIRQYLAMDPPQYPARRVRQRLCVYCPTLHAHAVYEKHLITAHSERLFHCEECHKYIDKKEFVIHMSLHAIEYSANLDKKKLQKVEKKEQFDGNENNEESETVQNDNTVQELKMAKANENLRNEFSDHSDMEFGLEPLPESVFKAIEDSQDSQSLEEDTIQTPKNECLSDESQPVDNLSNSADTASPPNEDNNSPAPETNDHNSETKKGDHKKLRTCPICSKVYKASSSYFYHLKYFHKRSRDHECGVCQKKFGTKATLTQHMAIHSGQYEFECNQCKKQFKSKASLYIHEQTHNGKKSWSCNQCQTSFRWKTHLSRHMTRHTAKKGHVCATCGRGFSIRCDLLRHARTHNAGNFTCDKCDLKFAQLRYLKAHTTKKHSA